MRKLIICPILLAVAMVTATAQSNNASYVLTSHPTQPLSNPGLLTSGNSRTVINYTDWLGRPSTKVSVGASITAAGTKDLIEITEYDLGGREAVKYLPLVSPYGDGRFVLPDVMETLHLTDTYTDNKPFAKTEYEASALDRPTSQMGAGEAWHNGGKAVTTEYRLNHSGDARLSCHKYTVSASGTSVTIANVGQYPSGALQVVVTTDEDGRVSYEFKSGDLTLLTRQVRNGENVDTYYVYDAEGLLRAVLPPLASKAMRNTGSYYNTASSAMDAYAYFYSYDSYNHLVMKKIPGADWVYYAYDAADHLVATQDGNLRSQGKWRFSICDEQGREVLTGLCTQLGGMTPTVTMFNGMVFTARYAGTAGSYKGYNIVKTYGAVSSTTSIANAQILTANYYDSYDFVTQVSGFSSLAYDSNIPASKGYPTKYSDSHGMLTGSFAAYMSLSSISTSGIRKAFYYDGRQRLIQSQSTNYKGGRDGEYTKYTFSGEVEKRYHVHRAELPAEKTEEYAYTYDNWGRPLTTTYTYGSNSPLKIADNTYDKLGRLVTNKRDNMANNITHYDYNIRSWPTSIASPIFSETLYYNESHNGSTPQWGGNISAMDWKTNDNVQRGYAYSYDDLSQLTQAKYYEAGTLSNKYSTTYGYDLMGNVTSLTRRGKFDGNGWGLVDNLSFAYNGNQVMKVTDAVTDPTYSGAWNFQDGANATTEYAYDENGNITKDLNKKILSIQYNCLNLPTKVTFEDGSYVLNIYAADGTKLYEYTKVASLTTGTAKYYCDNMVYENGSLKRVLMEGGYYDPINEMVTYNHTDHLGNVRSVIKVSNYIAQVNHYYPFGGLISDLSLYPQEQPYKYNGKELNRSMGLDWYDYGARMYDGMRFTTIDPMAEDYYSTSPYAYCHNNPILRLDPTGEFDFENTILKDANYATIAVLPKDYKDNKALQIVHNMAIDAGIPIMVVDNIDDFANAMAELTSMNSATQSYVLASHGQAGSFKIGEDNITYSTDFSALTNGLNDKTVFIDACEVGKSFGFNVVERMSAQTSSTVIAAQHPLRTTYKFDGSINYPYTTVPLTQNGGYIISRNGNPSEQVRNVRIDNTLGIQWNGSSVSPNAPLMNPFVKRWK